MKTIFINLLILLSFTCAKVVAETGSGCSHGCTWGAWQTFTLNKQAGYTPESENEWATVRYRYVICDGVIEVDFDWSTLTQSNEGALFTDQEIKEPIYHALALELGAALGSSPNAINVSFVFKTTCALTVKCSYEVVEEVHCDNGSVETDDSYSYNGTTYVDREYLLTCGEKCCKLNYEFGFSPNYATYIDVDSYPNSLCPTNFIYRDWKTNNYIPCTKNCQVQP